MHLESVIRVKTRHSRPVLTFNPQFSTQGSLGTRRSGFGTPVTAVPVPKGQTTIAQGFNLGTLSRVRPSPEGTAEPSSPKRDCSESNLPAASKRRKSSRERDDASAPLPAMSEAQK